MTKNIFYPFGCCDERLVTDFVDHRMTKQEAEIYLQKIENCIKTKNCAKCRKLLDDFMIMKQGCNEMKRPLSMPHSLQNKLLERIHEAFLDAKIKQKK